MSYYRYITSTPIYFSLWRYWYLNGALTEINKSQSQVYWFIVNTVNGYRFGIHMVSICTPCPPLPLISEPNKVQQFQFQTSGMLLSTGVQKLYESKTSWLLSCMLQFLDNLLSFSFFKFIGKTDHFTLDLQKSCGPSEIRPQWTRA